MRYFSFKQFACLDTKKIMTNEIGFGNILNARALERANPLCVGLDPFVELLPSIFGDGKTINSWADFFGEIIEIVGTKIPAIKPQIGLFEPFGAAGFDLVANLSQHAKSKGALVIIDAKRGDIGSTAQGYANAYLGPNSTIECDCITLNPYMGVETLEPYVKYCENSNTGIAVLVRTSNPGSVDFQELDCGGEPLWIKVAKALKPIETRLLNGEQSGLMVVIGATWPNQAKQLREILPKSQFLIPGFGAQGGSAKDALCGFVAKGNHIEGGVVNSSRGILYPKGAKEAANIKDWRAIINSALETSISELRGASENIAP